MAGSLGALACVVVVLAVSAGGAVSKSFTISNNCEYTVWPGVLSSAGSAGMDSTGFALAPGESRTMSVPSGWSGRLWGRTLCSGDDGGKFSCVTGDCGSGRHAAPPATLAEFTMDGSGGMDFYDVSLVDGYNLPVLVAPQGAAPGGNCAPTGCLVDLNGACPADLRVAASSGSEGGGGVACKSACEAFGSAEYCCSGEYGNPDTCRPSAYSQFFKNACPRAYSYAYDDATSTFNLRRRRHHLRHHLLPQHHQREVGRVDPGRAAADEQHRHGVPRRRPARGRRRRDAAAVPHPPLRRPRRRVARARRRPALIRHHRGALLNDNTKWVRSVRRSKARTGEVDASPACPVPGPSPVILTAQRGSRGRDVLQYTGSCSATWW